MPEKVDIREGTDPLARPPDEFFGRSREINLLLETAELLLKGMPSVILVTGQPGMGKSELLRQAAIRCLEYGGGLRPVYLSPVSGGLKDSILGLAGEMAMTVRGRALGSSAGRGFDAGEEWIRKQKGEKGSILRRLAKKAGGDDHGSIYLLLARLAASLAEEYQCRVAVFLDSADSLPQTGDLLNILLSNEAGGGRVSWIVALPGLSRLKTVNPESTIYRTLDLGPLPGEESEDLLARAMSKAGVPFAKECRECAPVIGGVPLLLWQAAASARLVESGGFNDKDSFLRFYCSEQADGFLYEYHRSRLALGFEDNDSKSSLEVMLHLMKRDGPPPDLETLSREMLKEESALWPVIFSLVERGLVDYHWGRVNCRAPQTLLDFCLTQSRRYLEACSVAESLSRLLLEKRAWLAEASKSRMAVRNMDEVRGFIMSWRDKTLPKSLFDYEQFNEIFKEGISPSADKLVSADKSRLALPEVLDAWREEYGGSDQVPPYAIDLLAMSPPGNGERERWMAVDIRLSEAEVTSEMVADFERRCRLFQGRTGAKPGDITGWIISGGTFSIEAMNMIQKLRFWSSAPPQLKLMTSMSDYGKTMKILLPSAEARAEEPYAFHMTIPARSETELVAARAVEQLAQSLPLGEVETGKVKMALVEACLNAFEHSSSEDRKVYLNFRVRSNCLEIEVFNRGRSFVPRRIVKPAIEDKMGASYKRGWGLSIIKELMDDVEFMEKEEGTLLKMTKYFSAKSREDEK